MEGTAVQMHRTNAPGETRISAKDPSIDALRQMTAEQLLCLGERRVAYLRASMCHGTMHFALFGANGALLAHTDAVEAVVEAAAEQGLQFISVH